MRVETEQAARKRKEAEFMREQAIRETDKIIERYRQGALVEARSFCDHAMNCICCCLVVVVDVPVRYSTVYRE